MNRANLVYRVRAKRPGSDAELIRFIQQGGDGPGIVYCLAQKETERVADALTRAGISAAAYHAGLGPEERKRRQDRFIAGDAQVIVATIAFGMGIDKADVRFVVHYDLPKSLEGYAQESGRAGRDGEPAECVLFYSYADAAKIRYFHDQIQAEAQKAIAKQQLQHMIDWATGVTCRRRALLAYFDEPFAGQDGPCCDVCDSPVELVDWTTPAQMLLSCMKRTGERFGGQHVIDVLRGLETERIQRLGHERLSTYGIGEDRPEAEWWYLTRQLLSTGVVRRAPEDHDALKVTEVGEAVLFKGRQVLLPAAPESNRRQRKPRDSRAARERAAPASDGPTAGKSSTVRATLQLLDAGRTLAEIAVDRGLAPSTVEGHIGDAIEAGESIDLDRLVAPERQRVIASALERLGLDTKLAPVREILGEDYGYGEIRFVLASLRRRKGGD
jgi:ATP-dependent DNA helicase RecQ